MTFGLHDATVVLLPGTGSDHDYVRRAFSPALLGVGAAVVTPPPEPAHLVDGYLQALDDAARSGPIAVGGVSIGAAVALAWALARPARVLGVLAALPAWTGHPHDAPAAVTAQQTADALRRVGLVAAIAEMRAGSPRWLAEELTRSWAGQWPALPDAMDEAARYVAPTQRQLAHLSVPLGVAAASDDPLHPIDVALEWVAAAPRAALHTVTLDGLGADPAVLGTACVTALLAAAS